MAGRREEKEEEEEEEEITAVCVTGQIARLLIDVNAH